MINKIISAVMAPIILLTSGCAWYQGGGQQQIEAVLIQFAEQEALAFLTKAIGGQKFDLVADFTGGAISFTRNLFDNNEPLSFDNIAKMVATVVPSNLGLTNAIATGIHDTVQQALNKGLSRDTALRIATDALDKAIADLRGKHLMALKAASKPLTLHRKQS